MITPETISKVTGAKLDNVSTTWPLVERAMVKMGMTSGTMKAVAAATIATEVAGFLPIREHGNRDYFRKYDNRADLGNNQLDDGYTYRGAGLIQLTGRANYRKYGREIGEDLERFPDRACQPAIAANVFVHYFRSHGMDVWCNRYDQATGDAKEKALQKLRRLVNGGLNGYDRFKRYTEGLLKATQDSNSATDKPAAIQPSAPGQSNSSNLPSLSSVPGVREGGKPPVPNKGSIRRGSKGV